MEPPERFYDPGLWECAPLYAIGMVEDITEQKGIEEALQLTRFSTDRAAVATFWSESNGQFFYVNEAACRSLGYSRDELLSTNLYDIDPSFPAERWSDHWTELKQRGSLTFETTHRKKDGSLFPCTVPKGWQTMGVGEKPP